MVYFVSYVLLSHKTRIFHENRFYYFYPTLPRFLPSIYPIKTLYDISSLSNTRSTLSYPIHFNITAYPSYHNSQHHTAEYEMIAEYEVTCKMYDTLRYLYESHLPFPNSKTHYDKENDTSSLSPNVIEDLLAYHFCYLLIFN